MARLADDADGVRDAAVGALLVMPSQCLARALEVAAFLVDKSQVSRGADMDEMATRRTRIRHTLFYHSNHTFFSS